MPRRKIREYQAKSLLAAHMPAVQINCAQVTPSTNMDDLLASHPWLSGNGDGAEHARLVVKPDMLFGKRGKSNLVLLDADFQQVHEFVNQRMSNRILMGGISGTVDHFIIEPFVPHQEEYYMSISCTRDGDVIAFSDCGGMEIEENWDKVKTITVEVDAPISTAPVEALLGDHISSEHRSLLAKFLRDSYKIFRDLNFHFMEMNPFTIVDAGCVPLDMRGELDDCALFKQTKNWKVDGTLLEFPNAFGQVFTPEEQKVRAMDEKTGASLKVTVLNPKGHIWAMVAGGGASVIYADTVADLGFGEDLGNYGEYSGDPSEAETYQYALTLLSLATAQKNDNNKALIIGGAIANFTDVAATFSGIIRAIKERAEELRQNKMKIFVRRGGPNYQIGLKKMRDLGSEVELPFEVYGPEVQMTKIVKLAIDWVNLSKPKPLAHIQAEARVSA